MCSAVRIRSRCLRNMQSFSVTTRYVSCTAATMNYRDDVSNAQQAKVYFRDDGSAERLEATNGFSLVTSTGGRLAAPTGTLVFDEHNQPSHGHLQDGVTIDSERNGRHIHGTSPTMELVFAGQGELRSAHLERGVQIVSDEETASEKGTFARIGRGFRRWRMWLSEMQAGARWNRRRFMAPAV